MATVTGQCKASDMKVFNVQYYGALGNGSHDDSPAIQAATDAAIAAGGGTVYFPLLLGAGSPTFSTYKVVTPISFNNDTTIGVRFLGEMSGSPIRGTVDGYIFDRHLATPNNTKAHRIFERLDITNDHTTGGGIRIGSSIGAVIRHCIINAHIDITTEDSVGVSSSNTQIQDCTLTGKGDFIGSVAIINGGGGSITGTKVQPGNIGILAYGNGLHISGGRIERCSQGHVYGLDSGGNDVGLSGFSCTGNTFEGCWTSIDFQGTVSGFSLKGISILGHDSGNAGPSGSYTVNVPTAQNSQYGIRIRADKARNGVISGFSASTADVATFLMEDSTIRGNVLITSGSMTNVATTWSLPTKAHTAKFMPGMNSSVLSGVTTGVAATYLFANLPGQSGAASVTPIEGEEYDITDSSTATWGQTVTGSGSNHVRTRYNGTNWTVLGT